uniref:type III toxin-antitoxin system ToxN/AbiQ family toxin n=1 Tax=Pasteurella multocida TaxID=747 RepID=UPI002076968B|nr:type III toxin-antitoxin system ToxN/AbiQ family toxin [Pasteurella multocida]
MKFYYVDSDYIQYLKQTDPKNVQNNYENAANKKPYVGIVLRVNDKDYFAPLSSDKNQKYKTIKESNPTVYKLVTHNNNYLGVIKLNNMIPVKKSELNQMTRESISEKDSKYQKLLNTQRIVINSNEDKIKQKAELLYRLVVEQKNDFYSQISAKFSQLEKACDNYANHKKVKESVEQFESTKQYQVDFSFNKEQSEKLGNKSYDVLVNGVKADELQKKDSRLSKALEGLANHKDMREKGITAEALKSGLIQPKQLANEIKVTKPEARLIDSAGNKLSGKDTQQGIAKAKSKDFAL